MVEEIKKDRSIGRIDADVKNILTWKLAQYQEQNIPVGVISDYIAKGLDEVELKVDQLKNYKELIDQEIKDLESHKEVVKIKAAEWLQENGIDRLEGVEISSITLTKPCEAKEKKKIEKTLVCTMSKNEINDFLVTQDLAKYDKKEVTKITPAKPAMIKINKKRK